jgi:hypothetical protein
VFDGTNYTGVVPESGFEVSMEVSSKLAGFVEREMGTVLDSGASQEKKRARPSENVDQKILAALKNAVLKLDKHLLSWEEKG